MAQGTERRGVVQNRSVQNLGQRKQLASIPGAPVGTPRGANFSQVGSEQRAVAKMLGDGASAVEAYHKKKVDEWRLKGRMAYAEGKTEDEIAAEGNEYTVQGFMGMKARTAYAEWYQSELDQINDSDHVMGSDQYQEKLSKGWKELSEVAGAADPYTRELMSAMAETAFPKLVAHQKKQNNVWKENETYNSYVGMLASEGVIVDPEASPEEHAQNLSELVKMNPGLSPERAKQAHIDAAGLALEQGNPNLFYALGFNRKQKIDMLDADGSIPAGLAQAVMMQESGGRRYDDNGNVITSSAGAKGEMQVMDDTVTDPGYGVRPADPNAADPLEERARVGRDYLAAMLKEYGNVDLALMAYNGGPGNVNKHMAEVGDPREGNISLNEFRASFPLKETREYVGKVKGHWMNYRSDVSEPDVDAVNGEYASLAEMVSAGYSPAQIKSLSTSYNAYQKELSNKFNKTRTLAEQQIYERTLQSGNLNEALNNIEFIKNRMGYTDDWAEKQATKAKSAVNKFNKSRGEYEDRSAAIANNTVRLLKPQEQTKAINEYRLNSARELQTQGIDVMSYEGQQALKSKQREFLIANSVVDKAWKEEISLGLSSTRAMKDGKVSDEALQAYQDYVGLAKESSPGFASQFLDEHAQNVVALAETYDSGGLNSEVALQQAIEQLSFESSDHYSKPVSINAEEIKEITDEYIEDLDPGFWAFFSKYESADTFSVSDDDIERAKKNPTLAALVRSATARELATDRTRSMTTRAAANKAMKAVQGRVELAPGGNVLVSGKQTSIRQDMGFPNANANNFVLKGLEEFLAYNGKILFGSAYVGRTEEADKQAELHKKSRWASEDASGKDERGLIGRYKDSTADVGEDLYIQYDSVGKDFIFRLWEEDDNGEKYLADHSVRVPADLVGDWMKSKQVEERSYSNREEELIQKYEENPHPDLQIQLINERAPWWMPPLPGTM